MTEYTPMAIWGRELRHYRNQAGLTQVQLAGAINYSDSLVSSVETGQVPATEEFARACDKVLNTGGALERQLDYRKGSKFPPWFGKWVPYEEGARVLRTFQSTFVYGLLQTKAYAESILGNEHDLNARLERQDNLLGKENSPTLHVVFDEAVLWRNVGGADVMREQLLHLLDVESGATKIQIRPDGGYLGTQGAFVLATVQDGTTGAYFETAIHGLVSVSPEDIVRTNELWESIKSDAYPVQMSRDLIKRTLEERWT